ncbi:hypothetical protein FPANT_8415 [Fusarium pseudoanthophilum]|uniref:2EXR domain-containing protein n=1 Tax=Fusarium pseudoanthophilum TaxID=48495 RepID=A0A8H5NZL9_9HYPO|nr:hypothetical protein FPANT_8415 [Fusarium pseudoanthophilum]
MESSKLSSGESPARHAGLFNPLPAKSSLTFHLFPNLPKEIRDMIWEKSLICERYIPVELWYKDKRSGDFCRPELLPPTDQEHRIVLKNPPRPNAIFGTNAESRAAACRFYRVHLPCYSAKGSQLHAPGTFWFNPELDTLEFGGFEHFTPLANDLWRNDRKKKGLRNVSFNVNIKSNFLFNWFYKEAASSDQLRQVVGRLEHVTFIRYELPRVMLAFTRNPFCYTKRSLPFIYPRSLPVAGASGSFSRQQDPRPIEDGALKNISLAPFPGVGRNALDWRNRIQELRAGRPCVFRFAYTTNAHPHLKPFITDKADALDYLNDEGKNWQERFDWEIRIHPTNPWRSGYTIPEQVDSGLETAFGFWTFPLEPQGPFANPGASQDTVYDLSAYRPELCVFHL